MDIVVVEKKTEQQLEALETHELSSYRLEQIGSKLVEKQGSLFNDLNQVIEHPLFQEFSQKYFRTWESTQLIIQLCQMYMDLDQMTSELDGLSSDLNQQSSNLNQLTTKFNASNSTHSHSTTPTCTRSKPLNPFEKICLLQECVLKQLVLGNEDSTSLVIQYKNPESKIEVGKRIYKTQPVLKDVADIMEYETTSEFIKKYFIRWDTSDLVVVLIRLYECFNECTTWTPEQKFGFLHHLMSDKTKRKLLAEKISEWKRQS
jgi:hypothetical protein